MASSVGLGDPDAPAVFDDFVAAFARAVSLRAARVAGGGARAPAPPGRASAKRLRDIFASACVDFDSAKKRSNAYTLALPQWRRLCLGSGFVARKFPASAADVVFAKTRRAGERELRAEDFASALACVAAETGKTFESVVDDAAKCAAGSGLFVGVSAASDAATRRETFRPPRNGVRASSSFSLTDRGRSLHGSKPKPVPVKHVVSVRESFPPARPNRGSAAPEPEPSSGLLDSALSRPRAEDFDAGDVDGDGLLSPGELAGVLMRSCHADEAEALELVRVCFEDVDLDKDGRVCFEEYRAFCKKAKRVLRRRALTAHSTTNARTRGAEVRRLTFGSGFASARANSRETKTKPIPSRPASARLASRSLDALGNAKEKAPRPASARTAQFFSRSFSEAPSRERVEPKRSSLNVAEESGASVSFAEDSTLDLTPMDLTSMDLTVDDAFIAEKDEPPRGGSSTRDLEPVAEALETDEERRGGGDDAGDEENALFQILTEDATNERLAVWRAEFDAHDARGTGRLDLELATFALAKLRLLEDLDVSLAARTLETRLAETAGGETEVALDFEAFARFATALETARATQKRSNHEAAIAQPVPVRKEYALDDAHPFQALFREMADSRGEMDGETFACVLRAARLTDDARLTDTGVDVVFARARARHQAERTARRVPYRIFLGALSLAAGHLGVNFETAAARVTAGAEAARARAAARAGNAFRDEPPHGKENALASPSPSSGGGGKKVPGEKKRSRLSAVFGGRA